MRKFPIGIQSFVSMRDDGYIYIDKTPFVKQLHDGGKFYFLSRPRRFGKSLFLDTLHQAFVGRKELFKGLFLYDNWDWETQHPVINISFGGGGITSKIELINKIENILSRLSAVLILSPLRSKPYYSNPVI